MHKIIKDSGKIILGVFLILIGIIGMVLPVIPGLPFALLGAAIISPEFGQKMLEWFRKLKEKFEQWKSKK